MALKRPTNLTRRKRLLYSGIVFLIFAALGFVVAEIALRMKYDKIEEITGVNEWQVGEWQGLTYHWDQYHPRYGWTNAANFRSNEQAPFRVSINSQGLRGENEYDPRPAAGRRRIAVLGDSFIFGEEVDDDQTIPFFLQRHLAGAEALNFGVHGYGLGQMAMRLEDEVFSFHPHRVVLVLLVPQDLHRDPLKEYVYSKPVFRVEEGRLVTSNVPVPIASQQPWLFRHSFAAARLWGRPRSWTKLEMADDFLDISRAILQRVQSQCRQHEVSLTLVTITSDYDIKRMRELENYQQYSDYMRRMLAEMNEDTLDLIPRLVRFYDEKGESIATPHSHWNAQGNEFIAQQIAEHLSRQ